MSGGLLLLFLAITIAIILILILRLKMNAAIAMFIGACFMGFASNVGFMQTIGAISTGFGNTMEGIGLSVGLMIVAMTGVIPAVAGALTQELVDLATILYALRALGGPPSGLTSARPSRQERSNETTPRADL